MRSVKQNAFTSGRDFCGAPACPPKRRTGERERGASFARGHSRYPAVEISKVGVPGQQGDAGATVRLGSVTVACLSSRFKHEGCVFFCRSRSVPPRGNAPRYTASRAPGGSAAAGTPLRETCRGGTSRSAAAAAVLPTVSENLIASAGTTRLGLGTAETRNVSANCDYKFTSTLIGSIVRRGASNVTDFGSHRGSIFRASLSLSIYTRIKRV